MHQFTLRDQNLVNGPPIPTLLKSPWRSIRTGFQISDRNFVCWLIHCILKFFRVEIARVLTSLWLEPPH